MADMDSIIYNIAAFICAFFVLEFGADKSIDHTAIVAERTRTPEDLIALVTAGAEWEELASSAAIYIVIFARENIAKGLGLGFLFAYFAFLSLDITFMRHD